MDPYSRPIMPHPMTMISRGGLESSSSRSVSTMRLPSIGIEGLCAGRVPHAIRM